MGGVKEVQEVQEVQEVGWCGGAWLSGRGKVLLDVGDVVSVSVVGECV